MPRKELVDSGVLIAAVNTLDPWHRPCADALKTAEFPLVTTSAALTEAFYFSLKRGGLMERTWQFIRAGGITIAPITDTDLPALETLMVRYADRPMDFADATLVHIAEREGLHTILTIDHDDFETYRIGRNAKFRILPARV